MHTHLRLGKPTSHIAIAIALATAGAALTIPDMAYAQAASNSESFSIPAGSLAEVLRAFSDRTGLQMIYSTEVAEGLLSAGVSGTMTRTEALARILAGTGLTFRFSNEKTVLVEAPAQGASGERVLGAVRVEGAQNVSGVLAAPGDAKGSNGSRDVTATEGTGSYTTGALTLGSKVPATINDVPASVAVLTEQRLKDQAITDFASALAKMPGVFATPQGSTLTTSFYSRGFEINAYQIDGGSAFGFGTVINQNRQGAGDGRQMLIDLSMYDHVELVRGAEGLSISNGNPSGVINLVRKKPLDHGQVLVTAELGSWQKYRASVDATSPLTADGRLRGRVVATFQDNNFFYDVAHDRKTIFYGIAEYDLTDTTLISLGANHQQQLTIPNYSGVPRYTDGTDIGLPRSTCFCTERTENDLKNTEMFFTVEQAVGNNWHAKLAFTRSSQIYHTDPAFRLFSPPDHVDNPTTLWSASSSMYGQDRQSGLEFTLSGKFRLFGQEQKLLFGTNMGWANGWAAGDSVRVPTTTPGYLPGSDNAFFYPFNDFNSDGLPVAFNYGRSTSDDSFWKNNIFGAYINLDLQPLKGLHMLTGLRFSKTRRSTRTAYICTADYDINFCRTYANVPNASSIGHGDVWYAYGDNNVTDSNISWPPSVSIRYDATANLSGYVTYRDIYQPNYFSLDSSYKSIAPTVGANREVGIKWAPGRTLNVDLSTYSNYQRGFAQRIGNPADASRVPAQYSCCYANNPNAKAINEGVDLQVSGEILKNTQIDASVTWGSTRYRNTDSTFRTAYLAYVPTWQFRLWATHNFTEGALTGLHVGGGLTGQTSHFVSGSYCAQYATTLNDIGQLDCMPGKTVVVNYVNPGRIVFSTFLAYDLTERYRVQLNVENLFDKRYYANANGLTQNFYGAPRSFNLTLSGKF